MLAKQGSNLVALGKICFQAYSGVSRIPFLMMSQVLKFSHLQSYHSSLNLAHYVLVEDLNLSNSNLTFPSSISLRKLPFKGLCDGLYVAHQDNFLFN